MSGEQLQKRTKTLALVWLGLYLLIGTVVMSIQYGRRGPVLPAVTDVMESVLPLWAGGNLLVLLPLGVKVLVDARKAAMKKLFGAACIATGFVALWSLAAGLVVIVYFAMV